MAVIWQTRAGIDHYEVRTAGRSVRLYKNRVFHSQWNETRPLSGGVWDLLFLPALFMPRCSVKRVLVLGVGGGAVIRQYTLFLPVEQIVGVELDPLHLRVAREFFGLKLPHVKLVEADAIRWVAKYRGPKFDVVIEDLFTEVEGEPLRVVDASEDWFRQLRALLRPGGSLVVNFEEPAQMRAASRDYQQVLGDEPDCRFSLTLPTYGNCVGSFLSAPGDPAQLRKRLDELLVSFPACRQTAQQFRIRRISSK